MSRARTTDILFTGLAFAVLYFLLRSVGQTPDGLSYAVAARSGIDLYHPHHLLYVPVTRFLFLLTGGQDALLAGVLHNLIWLVVLALGAWRLAGYRRWSHGAALLAAVFLLSSRGVLFYGTHVETYLPALACLTMFVAVWFKPVRSDPAAVAWLALAVLYHQTNVLLVVPMLVTSARWRQDFRRVVLPAGLAVLAMYVAGWWLAGRETGFLPWLLTYARVDVPAWGSFSHWSVGGLLALGLSQMRMIVPVPESLAVPGAVLLLAAVSALVVYSWGRVEQRRERRFAVVFLATYLPFFLWWIPSDPDFFLATLLPLWWLGLLLWGDLPARWRGRWLVAPAVVLLLGNLWFTARPLMTDFGESHGRAMRLDRSLPPDLALVVGYGVEQELAYYTERELVFEGDSVPLDEVARWPAVAVEMDYLRLLLTRGSEHDIGLLRGVLGCGGAGLCARGYRVLPGQEAVVIGEGRMQPVAWDEQVRELREVVNGVR